MDDTTAVVTGATGGLGSAVAHLFARRVALVRGFAAELDRVVGLVDPGRVATDPADGEGEHPAAAAERFPWAAVEADPGTVDGRVVDRRTWREATG